MENWIDKMKLFVPLKIYSQFGEETYLKCIFYHTGTFNKFFVDIGAGGAEMGLSNTRYFREIGWEGLSFDMKDEGNSHIIKAFVTPFNILFLLEQYHCPVEFDFLNIDIDSFDYDVLEKILTRYSPRIICFEFNPALPIDSLLKLKYEPGYTWNGTQKYGCSFGAARYLLGKNYHIVLNIENVNLLAVRKDLISGISFQEVTANQRYYLPKDPSAEFISI